MHPRRMGGDADLIKLWANVIHAPNKGRFMGDIYVSDFIIFNAQTQMWLYENHEHCLAQSPKKKSTAYRIRLYQRRTSQQTPTCTPRPQMHVRRRHLCCACLPGKGRRRPNWRPSMNPRSDHDRRRKRWNGAGVKSRRAESFERRYWVVLAFKTLIAMRSELRELTGGWIACSRRIWSPHTEAGQCIHAAGQPVVAAGVACGQSLVRSVHHHPITGMKPHLCRSAQVQCLTKAITTSRSWWEGPHIWTERNVDRVLQTMWENVQTAG
jgi:hypothetical protein